MMTCVARFFVHPFWILSLHSANLFVFTVKEVVNVSEPHLTNMETISRAVEPLKKALDYLLLLRNDP